MLFSTSKKTSLRKQRLKTLQDTATDSRKEIEVKLKEAKAVDQQLAQVLSDTRELTASLQQKLAGRLKITRNTLKTICHNIREGVVILNSKGDVIETNAAFEKTCFFGDKLVGTNFKQICLDLYPTKEDGSHFVLTNNFSDLAQKVFESKDFTSVIQPEIMLEIHPKDVDPFKCIFSLSPLDNDPEHLHDVSFILFFKCMKRSTDRERRSKDRTAAKA